MRSVVVALTALSLFAGAPRETFGQSNVDSLKANWATIAARGQQMQLIAYLTQLRTLEEFHFVNANRYVDKTSDLEPDVAEFVKMSGADSATMRDALRLPEGATIKSLTVTAKGDGWAAVIVSSHLPGMQCGMAVEAINPVTSLPGMGEPVCK